MTVIYHVSLSKFTVNLFTLNAHILYVTNVYKSIKKDLQSAASIFPYDLGYELYISPLQLANLQRISVTYLKMF